MAHARSELFSGRFRWATGLLGFGFGGFFDGILLHQILQWHHLLSALRQGPLVDLRGQLLADGLFHALMYLVAAIGLLQLARSRSELSRPGAGRELLSGFLVGFGAWHVVDAVLSHWLTGIHRIRMDADNPLAWDLLWLLVFGLVPLAVALWQRGRRSPGGGLGVAAALLVAAATGIAGAIAARPADPTLATLTVVLRPRAEPARLLGSLAASDTRILWSDRRGTVWVLKAGPALSRLDLYRAGALFVSGTMLPAGCSAFLR